MKKVLYISYDGMTDPLGQSQVIPYVQGLSILGYEFTILSFEKEDRFSKEGKSIKELLDGHGIGWRPLSFTRRPPLLSKAYDALRMRRSALTLHKDKRYDIIHCRSYVAAAAGLEIKRIWGTKFLFDMRGFWPDEKKDGGSWDQRKLIFRAIYRSYKKKEVDYLASADAIICLTDAGRDEMMTWPGVKTGAPVTVIPCCADMDLFTVRSDSEMKAARKELQIPEATLVLSYLGSLGAWYMLEEMLEFFSILKREYPSAQFLFVTHSNPKLVLSRLAYHGLSASDVIIVEADRQSVPRLIKASDVNISFIKPVYSKLSSSPTKLGEVLSMGIPVICNSGVGDVTEIVRKCDAGVLVSAFTEQEFAEAVASLPELLRKNPGEIRASAAHWFDLNRGIELYRQTYETLTTR